MEEAQLGELLKRVNLKLTKSRLAILELFKINDCALSYQDIQEKLTVKEDKATVYRTLKTFMENGLVHEIIGNDRVLRYASCKTNCSIHEHNDTHAHFHCIDCLSIYCIKTPKIDLELPEHFVANNYMLNVEGVCEKCIVE